MIISSRTEFVPELRFSVCASCAFLRPISYLCNLWRTLRTFIAIEIPANVRAKVADHISSLRRECPEVGASWSREDNLHLTLKFLGDVAITRITALSDAAAKA